jgi:formate dehydrogenase major subunit
VPSLGASFGRGAATTAQWDLANSDCVVIMGSNMAENHPIAFRFVMQAKEKGATVIHIDPRFTRTSALADLYAPVRAGSDIAFLGGVINYILENDLWFKDYVLNYTNISTIIHEDFKDANELGGVFSGLDRASRQYKPESWQYQGEDMPASLAEHFVNTTSTSTGQSLRLKEGPPPRDPMLQHPRCVYQILRRHYAPYTPEVVERVTGCPRETFLKVCEALARNSGRERTAAWCYAVGWTHHTTGVQMIRGAAIIQTLLGNIGRPGGGILALRGHSSIQGSTDIPTLYNLLPGYLPQPHAKKRHHDLKSYIETEQEPTGWWANFPKYIISLLRAWYGDAVSPDNDWGYDWIPKIVGDYSQLPMTLAMRDGLIRGLFVTGQNPVIGGQNSRLIRKGLANLEWMVVRETFENETASFWYKSPEVERGELRPEDVKTEIFLMPAALPGEKEGTFTNTHRLVQWHDKVVDPPGDCRSETWFFYHLGRRLKDLYAGSDDPRDAGLLNLTWDYPVHGALEEPSADAVLREINGYTWPEKVQVPDFKHLEADGSTACGCWIYTGVYPRNDHNQAQSRRPDGPDGPGTHLGWGFAWPSNRRIMYNRASADPDGKPWSERKRYMQWDPEQEKWVGPDEPDFSPKKPPDYEPDWSQRPGGMDAHDGRCPFMMIADGKAWLFVPSGMRDGPMPTHYEPVESPVKNPLYQQQDNPVAKKWPNGDNKYHDVGDPRYPHVLTTYRLTEHHSGGIPTRMVPALAELQPHGFAEIPPELADELGIKNLDWVVLSTARGEVETRALVTGRLRPFEIDGRRVYQIGMPWSFGWQGYATGDVANTLASVVGDPNTTMHEGKAFTCGLRKGRLSSPPSPPGGVGGGARGGQRPMTVHPRALDYTDSLMHGPIPDESELTAGAKVEEGEEYGFFTDTSLCIGCKACEVACKEWNALPADDIGLTGHSYDNTSGLSATTWRHVAFLEKLGLRADGAGRVTQMRPFQSNWLMASDVCKHCQHAGCVQACPTGALFHTEYGTVVVQQDVCNGCGYCVPSCPFGVVELNLHDGMAHKCTLCYDRLKAGFEPACAKSCPTDSIQFGKLGDLQKRARRRVDELHAQGVEDAYLYGAPDSPGATGGIGSLNAFFLLLDRPEVYNLPTAPTLPSRRVGPGLLAGLATMAGLALAAAAVFGGNGK